MTAAINLSDVPEVASSDLALVMQKLVRSGNGLILLKGVTDEVRATLEDAVWETFQGAAENRLAVLMRLENLIAVFASRRLRDVFLAHGLLILPHILHIAAYQRLNIHWGFNPQKFLSQLTATVEDEGDHQAPASSKSVLKTQSAETTAATMAA
jgi:hypothetical protein